MITVERIFDDKLVDSIVTSDGIWEFVCDDATSDRSLFSSKPVIEDPNIWLLVKDGDNTAGCVFLAKTDYGYELHTNLYPEFRGKFAVKAWGAIRSWIDFNTMDGAVVKTYVFDNAKMKPVRLMARICGFTQESVEPYENTVDGCRVNKILYTS